MRDSVNVLPVEDVHRRVSLDKGPVTGVLLAIVENHSYGLASQRFQSVGQFENLTIRVSSNMRLDYPQRLEIVRELCQRFNVIGRADVVCHQEGHVTLVFEFRYKESLSLGQSLFFVPLGQSTDSLQRALIARDLMPDLELQTFGNEVAARQEHSFVDAGRRHRIWR